LIVLSQIIGGQPVCCSPAQLLEGTCLPHPPAIAAHDYKQQFFGLGSFLLYHRCPCAIPSSGAKTLDDVTDDGSAVVDNLAAA